MRLDLLSSLLSRFSFSAETFFAGEFCGANDFGPEVKVGHLHFVRRGPVVMEHEDGSAITATEPTLIFYPRPYPHRLVVQPGTMAELVCANVLFKEAARSPFALAFPPWLAIPLKEVDGVEAVARLLFAEAAGDWLGQRLVMDRLCDILVVQLIRHALGRGKLHAGVLTGFSQPGIARALTLIHQDPAGDLRLERLAAEAAMSRSRFARLFHELVGVTPASYVADWRLALAENLLRQDMPVKAVAEAVGYGTQQSFTRAFVDRTGMPPKQWLSSRR